MNVRSIVFYVVFVWSVWIVVVSFCFFIVVFYGFVIIIRRVFVCELICVSVGVCVFVVVRVGYIGYIFWVRCDFEFVWLVRFGRVVVIVFGVDLGIEDGEDGDVSLDRVYFEDCFLVCILGVFEFCCCFS